MTKIRFVCSACVSVAILFLLVLSTTIRSQTQWQVGDVFVGVGDPYRSQNNNPNNGRILHYNGSGATLLGELSEPERWATTGCAYFPGVISDTTGEIVDPSRQGLYTTSFSSIVNRYTAGAWVQGGVFDLTTDPIADGLIESIAFDKDGSFFVATPWATTNRQLFHRKTDGTVTPYTLPNMGDRTYGGADWIDLARDGNDILVYYTSEASLESSGNSGDLPLGYAGGVHKIRISPASTITDAATVGWIAGVPPANTGGAHVKAFALRVLPNNQGILVAGASNVFWMDHSGTIIKTYNLPVGVDALFALNISPDGQYFWTATLPHFAATNARGRVFKVHIASGITVAEIDTGAPSVNGLCVVREYLAVNGNWCTNPDGSRFTCPIIPNCAVTPFEPGCVPPGMPESCSPNEQVDENKNGLLDETSNPDGPWCDVTTMLEGPYPESSRPTLQITGEGTATASDAAYSFRYKAEGAQDWLAGLPGWISFSHPQLDALNRGYLYFNPGLSDAGTYIIEAKYDDGAGFTATGYHRIVVTDVPHAPELGEIDNQNVNEGALLSFTIIGSDQDGDTLTYSASGLPQGATLNPSTGAFSWTPTYLQAGSYQVTFTVSDGNLTDSQPVTITVNDVNRPPVLGSIGSRSIDEWQNLAFRVSATDPDIDNVLTYSATILPIGATFNSATGAFSWTPNGTQAGPYQVTFTVTDGHGGEDSETVTITVADVTNQPPACGAAAPNPAVIWPPNHKFVPVSIVGVSDPEGGPLTIRITQILQDEPTNTQGDGTTEVDGSGINTPIALVRAERSGTPKVPGNGRVYAIHFTATDAAGAPCLGSVKVSVPHDQRPGAAAVDDGVRFDSTTPGGAPLEPLAPADTPEHPQMPVADEPITVAAWHRPGDRPGRAGR